MKTAFYCAVKTEEEKEVLKLTVTSQHREDESFQKAYIDVVTDFNEALSKRKCFTALMRTIQKGKVNIVLIPSIESLYMTEMYTGFTLGKLKECGADVIVGYDTDKYSTWVKTQDEISEDMKDRYDDFIEENFTIPIVTMEDFVFRGVHTTIPLVYKKSDEEVSMAKYTCFAAEWIQDQAEEGCLVDIIRKYNIKMFLYYHSEIDGWYFINEYGMTCMKYIEAENYRIFREFVLEEAHDAGSAEEDGFFLEEDYGAESAEEEDENTFGWLQRFHKEIAEDH